MKVKTNNFVVNPEIEARLYFKMFQIISNASQWKTVIEETLKTIGENLPWQIVSYWEAVPNSEFLKRHSQWQVSKLDSNRILDFQIFSRDIELKKNATPPGEIWEENRSRWTKDVAMSKPFCKKPFGIKEDSFSGYSVPILVEDEIIGVFGFFSSTHQKRLDKNIAPLLVNIVGQLGQLKKRLDKEKELILAKEEAVKANKSKSEFLCQMSHELRTPLNAIIGFSQILMKSKNPVLDSRFKLDVKTIMDSGQHLLLLINEILDLSRIESGKLFVSISPIDLKEILSEIILSIQPLLKSSNIIYIDSFSNLDQVFILADKIRLKQVVLNLIANAIKYNVPKGSISLNYELQEDNYIRINVKDTGTGIPKNIQGRIFDPFQRGEAEDSGIEGTGMGLPVSKRLVELMDGDIGFSSVENEGSCFFIDLPKARELAGDQKNRGCNQFLFEEKEIMSNQNEVLKILYIEDNYINLTLVQRVVEMDGRIDFYFANDGNKGLESAQVNKPDLILLDINLPGINGFEVLKKLKENQKTNRIPVVAISANAMVEDIDRAKEAGFEEYYTKPIKVSTLLNIFNQYKELKAKI